MPGRGPHLGNLGASLGDFPIVPGHHANVLFSIHCIRDRNGGDIAAKDCFPDLLTCINVESLPAAWRE